MDFPKITTVLRLCFIAMHLNTLFALEPSRSSCDKQGNFKADKKGFSLSVTVLSTFQVSNPMECSFYCMDHELCKSYNYEHESGGSTYTCELLDKIKEDSPNNFLSRSGFTHYEAKWHGEVTCTNNPCRNGGTCLPACSPRNFDCVCVAEVSGRQCETDNRGFASCQDFKNSQAVTEPDTGTWLIIGSNRFQVSCDDGWTLVARFSNKDGKNWMHDSGAFWYDREVSYGSYLPGENADMINEAFWLLQGTEFRITKSNDAGHTSFLRTYGSCLNGKTFRQKISSYGRYTGLTQWSDDRCRGNCGVSYAGAYTSVAGFRYSQCDGNIQSRYKIGFWCDWGSGDGAVLMIGGGGSSCGRADHGIGITEANYAKFGESWPEYDFGDDAGYSQTTSYALNLWVR